MKKTFGSSANVNVQEDRAGLEGSGADHGGSHPGGSYHASTPCWLECRARSLMSKHWVYMVLGLCADLQSFLCLYFLSPYDPLMGLSPVLCSLDRSCMPSPADLMTLTVLLCALASFQLWIIKASTTHQGPVSLQCCRLPILPPSWSSAWACVWAPPPQAPHSPASALHPPLPLASFSRADFLLAS